MHAATNLFHSFSSIHEYKFSTFFSINHLSNFDLLIPDWFATLSIHSACFFGSVKMILVLFFATAILFISFLFCIKSVSRSVSHFKRKVTKESKISFKHIEKNKNKRLPERQSRLSFILYLFFFFFCLDLMYELH